MIILEFLIDGFFAAIAAIGFGAISNPPRRAYAAIALLAAVGHALRYGLMHYLNIDIATASIAASFTIGMGSVVLGARTHCPITVLYIPALLPMIPGMYAYRIVFTLIMFLQNLNNPAMEQQYIQQLFVNGVVTATVIFNLAVGATIPIFLFQQKAFAMTRYAPKKWGNKQME